MGRRERLAEVGEQFQQDVQEHALTILHDDGLYRHLRLKRPGTTNHYFDLVTWPGYLAYAGDMGEFVFTRVEDMFTFFRGHKPNPGYWAEKAQAIDKNGGLEKFSEDTFKASLQERLDDFIESYYPAPDDPDDETDAQRQAREEAVQELRDEIDVALLHLGDDCDGRAVMAAVMEVEDAAGRRPFSELYEYSVTEWTWRFLWCCHALPWAIALYDIAKAAPVAVGVTAPVTRASETWSELAQIVGEASADMLLEAAAQAGRASDRPAGAWFRWAIDRVRGGERPEDVARSFGANTGGSP